MIDTPNMFDYLFPQFKITKPIRLIEMFAGIGSQAKALENLEADFTHWKVIEFDEKAVKSYNAIHGTSFETSDIRSIHAGDLEINDRDIYIYILTYSFPCQDLSMAGHQRGMSKGSGTRSGLLWEVERILDECGGNLPQILLMENVPQVIGKKNIKDFQLWRKRLEELGYSNYVSLLNSKDYGIPQNRERCFMVSILGNYSYVFPKKQKPKKRLKDMLESNVPESYYLSDARLEKYADTHTHTQTESGIIVRGSLRPDKVIQNRCRVLDPNGNVQTLTATDYKDPPKIIEYGVLVPEKTKKGYRVAHDGDGIYTNRPHQKRGTVQKSMVPTIKTSPNDIGVVVNGKE